MEKTPVRNATIKEKIEKYFCIIKKNEILLIFFCLQFFLHIGLRTNISDDGIHRTFLETQTIFQRACDLYFNVNGKVWPDLCAAIFTYIHPIFWKIVDSVMYLLMGYCIYLLFLNNEKNKRDSIILSCIVTLFLPLDLVVSAGYVAGSTNYIWTATMMLIAFIPLYRNVIGKTVGEKGNWKGYLLYILAAVYAGNQEQSLAILLTMYLLLIVFMRKRTYFFTYVMTGILCLDSVILFISPGHQSRAVAYSRFCIPYYPMLSFLDKVHLGITSTFSYFLGYYRPIFGVLCLLITLNVFRRYREFVPRLFGAIPLLWVVITAVMPNLSQIWPGFSEFEAIFCFIPEWGYNLTDFKFVDAMTYSDWRYYLPLIVTIVVIGLMFVDIVLIFEKLPEKILFILILCAGFCSRVIMGFSPTLYGSSYRTFSFMYLSFIIMIAVLAKRIIDEYSDKKMILLIMIAFCVGTGY